MNEFNKNRDKKERGSFRWDLLPLQFILVVLPLILYMYVGTSGYSAYPWSSVYDNYADIFLHGKMVVFQIVSVLMLAVTVYKMIKMKSADRKKALLLFIPLIIYLGFAILSTVCSVNMKYSIKGSMDAKEPLGVLAGYVIVAFYTYLIIDSVDCLKQLISSAIIGGGCMAIVGVLQAVGKDMLAYEWVQRLLVGQEFLDMYGPLELQFPVGVAYGTLYNPNYVGTYVAMYAPLLLLGIIMYSKLWQKVASGVFFVGLLIMLFASQSRTGLVVVAATTVITLLFRSKDLWKWWYLVIPGITFVIMSFSLMDTYKDNLLTNRLARMFAIKADDSEVSGVDTTGSGVRVKYKDTEYTVAMAVSSSSFNYFAYEGKEKREVRYNEDKTYGYFTLSNGDEITIQTANYEGTLAFGLNINGRYFYFTNQLIRGNYKFINRDFNRLDECVCADNVFKGYEAVASGRGYVWGRTIPLLLKHIALGSGPDTFGIVFPQNDYVARYKSGYDTIIFTRPHNFYLQMGVQTGVLSLIAFLTFYVMYFVGSFRRYFFCKFEKKEQWSGFILFTCSIGFMVAGIANDSLITVSPMFYLFLGAGMVVNHKFCPISKKKGLE